MLDVSPVDSFRVEVEAFYTALYAPGTGHITDVTEMSVTSNGRRVTFAGPVYMDLGRRPVSRLADLDLESGVLTPRRPVGQDDRLPRWSPDGRTLAFLADRDEPGVHQVWLARDGHPPIQAPAVPGVIESLSWSPDGKRLLLGLAGFGADVAGVHGGGTTSQARSDSPVWTPKVDRGDAENLWRQAWIIDLGSRSPVRVSPDGLNVWELSWCGHHLIVAVVSDFHSESSWYTSRLVTIALEDGAVRDVYRSGDQLGVPTASPSGRWLAVIEGPASDRMMVAGQLILIDRNRGEVRRVDSRGVDVSHVAWRDDDSAIYSGLRGLDTVLGEIEAGTGRAHEWWASFERTCGRFYPQCVPLPTGALIAGEAWAVPPEIARVDQTGYRVLHSLATEPTRATQFRHGIVEPFKWTARDGLEMEGVLIRPAGPGPWPVVVNIHGGPVWAWRNRWQARLRGARLLLDHGVALFYPNPRGSNGRGLPFARLVQGDMGGEDTHDHLSAVDELVGRGIADPRQLGVTGSSYGGFMSAWLVTQTERFAAAVVYSPVTNWYSQHRTSQIPYFDHLYLDGRPSACDGLYFERSPVFHADRVRTPVLQLAGARDQSTPPTQALEFHRSLLENRTRSVLVTYPNAGHGISTFPEAIDATARCVGWFLEHFAAHTSRA